MHDYDVLWYVEQKYHIYILSESFSHIKYIKPIEDGALLKLEKFFFFVTDFLQKICPVTQSKASILS